MEENNFQRLMAEDEDHYTQLYGDKIRSNVWETMGFIRLVGEMVTMFVPRVFDVFVMATGGGRSEENDQQRPPDPPSSGRGPAPGEGPSAPPDDPDR